jgi:long-chain acyl-CoA synthetase
MQGYHNRPEETAQVLLADGGFRTGDLGRVDADGYLYITGRIKERYKLQNGKYVVPALLEEQLKLSPFIANALIFGDNQPYNVALIVPDSDAVRKWAEENGVSVDDPSSSAAIQKLIEQEVARCGSAFKSYERPKKLSLLGEDFTTENDLLTPSMKVKRRNVLARYAKELEALYC